jgi:hypothetical protein
MSFALQFDTGDVERAIDQLGNEAPRACVRALNRAVVSARAAMVPAITADMGLTATVVRERIVVGEATVTNPVARLYASFRRIPLINFGAKGREPSRGHGHGVTVRGKTYPRAFLATMSSGHRGVFERRATRRLPIYELHGPSLAHVFQKHVHLGIARGHESLMTNLKSEIRFALSQRA